MNDLTALLKPLELDSDFTYRKIDLITALINRDKRFLPLVASEIFQKSEENFWNVDLDPMALTTMSVEERNEVLNEPRRLANIIIEQINTFIKVNDIVLEDEPTKTFLP